MIARLHVMYERSRLMLIFLVIAFLAVNIACGVITAIGLKNVVGGKLCFICWLKRTQLIGWTPEEFILSGIHACNIELEGNGRLLNAMVWMFYTGWEVLALCLSVWIAVKHFRNLRRLGLSTGSIVGDCFTVLIQFHALYFARWAYNVNMVISFCSSSAHASFVCVSCLQLIYISPAFVVRRPATDICL